MVRPGAAKRRDHSEAGPARAGALIRPVVLLSAASFASVATMRVADPLLPQVAQEFGVAPGEAAVITTAFALAYGLCQLIYGPLGDRFGKYLLITLMTLISAMTVAAAGLAGSLQALGLARLAAGATCAAIVPLSMAFIGDHVGYQERQTTLARFLTGTIFGTIAGQVLGGVLGDLLNWRAVFALLGGLFLLVGLLLMVELRSARVPAPRRSGRISIASLLRGYVLLFQSAWVRVVLATVFLEGLLFYGAFTYVGAFLRDRFGLDYAVVGLVLGAMGMGGLLYTASVGPLVRRLGERGLAIGGGTIVLAGFGLMAHGPLTLTALACTLLGLGFVMLHNTLQTNATQMAPAARGLAVSTFANALFLGQAAGVWLFGLMVDGGDYRAAFVLAGGMLLGLALGFATLLRRRPPG